MPEFDQVVVFTSGPTFVNGWMKHPGKVNPTSPLGYLITELRRRERFNCVFTHMYAWDEWVGGEFFVGRKDQCPQ